MEQPIIDPISLDLIKAELTPAKKLRDTNKSRNEIYVLNHHDSPNIMKEIGRLREEAFRDSGGGSGLSMDIDEFDTMENPYQQLIVWDPEAEKILGGYRYILGTDIRLDENGQPLLATSHMFHFSEKFIKEYLPYTIELGRSFVSPEYQSSKAGTKALFALDNLWDGLGALAIEHPNMKYFFGKMTMYPEYNREARDLIQHFLFKHFEDKENLIRPIEPKMPDADPGLLDVLLKDEDFKSDYRNLKDAIRKLGTTIPPLINTYMNSSPTMKMFGTAVNKEFSDVEETGILISFNEMYPEKRDRHKEPYMRHLFSRMKSRFPQMKDELAEKFSEKKDRLRDKAMAAINMKKA